MSTPAETAAPAAGLPARLRAATCDLHRELDAALRAPGRIGGVTDYAALLSALHRVHAPLEAQLTAGRWTPGWRRVGIDIGAHLRADSLLDDLSVLGVPLEAATALGGVPADVPGGVGAPAGGGSAGTFGWQLGTLYVLAGSALGGPSLASVVEAAVGAVPTSFLRGPRTPGRCWRSVLDALARFDGDPTAVVAGASAAFEAFARHLLPPFPAGQPVGTGAAVLSIVADPTTRSPS